jgi:hypothetical protein
MKFKPCFIIVLASLLLLFSCNKDKKANQPDQVNYKLSDEEIIKIATTVGEFNDDGLEAVYNYLTNYRSTANRGEVADFTQTKLNEISAMAIVSAFDVKGLNLKQLYCYDSTPNKIAIPIDMFVKQKTDYDMSIQLKDAIEKINVLLLDSINRTNKTAFDNIINTNISKIDREVEKFVLVSFATVGRNSAIYWDSAYSKWDILANDLLANGRISGKQASPGKDVIYADCVGAGVGGVRGALVGAAGGTATILGVGTVGGAAAGGMIGMIKGAVVSSAGDAIHSLIKKWLKW